MVDFLINVKVDPARAVAGANKVKKSLRSVQNGANRLRTTLLGTFGIFGATQLISGAIRSLAGFEQAMATVRAVSGATGKQFEELTQQARDLGLTTRFTATDAAEGLVDLSRAGFTAAESMTAVRDTLNLAVAGGLSLKESADVAAAALRGFRLEADQMRRVADVLTATANNTNTTVGQLGDALKFVGPIAAGVGVTFEETAASLGLLSDSGLKASLAGTGLKRVISELEGPTSSTAKLLQRLGVRTSEVRISSVGLSGALERLKEAGVDTGLALQIFGDRGGPAFEILANQLPKLKELNFVLETSAGIAKRTADIMDDNLFGSVKRLASSFEALILEVGRSGGTSGLRGAIDALGKGFRFLAANSEQLINFAKNLAIVLGPRVLVGAIRLLGTAIAANPIGLLLTIIAGVIAVVPDLQSKITDLIGTLSELAGELTTAIDFKGFAEGAAQAIDFVIAVFSGLGASLGALFDALGTKPEAVGEIIKKAFRDAAEFTLDTFRALFQTLGNLITFFGKTFVDVLGNSVTSAKAILAGELGEAQIAADNITIALGGVVKATGEFGTQFSQNLGKLRDVELLPTVKLSQEAFDLGKVVANEFERGIAESEDVAQPLLDSFFGVKKRDLVKEAKDRFDIIEQSRGVDFSEPVGTGTVLRDPAAQTPLSNQAQEILESIDANTTLKDQEVALNEIYRQRKDLLPELNQAFLDLQIAALESSTNMGAGFERAFLKMAKEAWDFAAVAEAAVNTFADGATNAITSFLTTGEDRWKEFGESVLNELARILVRLLVVQAISAALGVVGGGASTIVGQGVSAAGGGGGRARGGTVQPDRSYIVGEEGPELFEPNKTGTIVPNAASVAAAPPQVNVQVVNVDDPGMVPQSITSGSSDEAIINMLSRNKSRVTQVLR